MNLRHLLTAAALALASVWAWAADPPEYGLPPHEKPKNVQAYDSVQATDVPWHVRLVKAPEAWAKNPAAKGKKVKVGVLDTGCQCDHPAIKGSVVATYNAFTRKTGEAAVADGHGHGTFCCGEVLSVAPEVELIVVKVLSDQGSGSSDVIARGIDWAVAAGADVLSASLGGNSPDEFQEGAVKRALAAGVIFVAAAGNAGGGPGRDTEGWPARYPGVVSVAACDKDRRLASFSSWGPNVITTDPGVDITGPLPGNKQGEMSGTSMACPIQAAKAAMWVATSGGSKDKERPARFRETFIKASPFAERNNARGHGLYAADKIVPDGRQPPPTPPTPAPEKVYVVDLAKLKADGYTAVKFELGGPTPAAQPIPVASLPEAQPVPTWNGYNPAPVWGPAPPVYQTMPSTCPPGGCQPVPVRRGWFR